MHALVKAMRFLLSYLALVAFCGCDRTSAPTGLYSTVEKHPLDAFLHDRPAAAPLLERYPQLERWLRTKLVEPIGPDRIAWSAMPPPGDAPAVHRKNPQHPFIVICISDRLPPADQLAALLYETLNAQNRAHFLQIEDQVAHERISRDDYIDAVLAREHTALLRTKALLPELFPLTPEEQASLHLYPAFMETPEAFAAFEDWRLRYAAGFDAREHYGRQYDRNVAKARNRNAQSGPRD